MAAAVFNAAAAGLAVLGAAVELDEECQEVQAELQLTPNTRMLDVIRKIGSGAYGSVYSAHDHQRGAVVAIKRFTLTDVHEQEDHGMPVTIIRETGILRSLRHPNVVQLLDQTMCRQTKKMFLVFELCECNLRQYMEGMTDNGYDKMPLSILRTISNQILSALAYCHRRRVIHRDLKPENILVDHMHVKIADFGLARALSSKDDAKYTGMAATIWYRPPEIILGATVYDASVDTWSAGCIINEMANLKVTFEGDNEVHMLMKIFFQFGTPSEESWPDITSLPHLLTQFPQWQRKEISEICKYPADPSLASLVESMLEMYPGDRISPQEALEEHAFFSQDEGQTYEQVSSTQPADGQQQLEESSSSEVQTQPEEDVEGGDV